MKKKLITIFITLFVLTLGVAYSSYVIHTSNKSNFFTSNQGQLGPEDDSASKKQYKITFDSTEKVGDGKPYTIYVDKDSPIGIDDAPFVISDSSPVEWKYNNKTLGADNGIMKADANYNFTASKASWGSLSNSNKGTYDASKATYTLDKVGYQGSAIYGYDGPTGTKLNVSADHDATYTHHDETVLLDAKNKKQSTIILSRDIILNGASEMGIGGINGYRDKNDTGWTPIDKNGYIVGNYSELDLNGHNIILSNNYKINSFGSIIDSKGTGKIIVEKGSEIHTPLVVYDIYRADSMPMAYFNNTPVFNVYQMPYLTATTVFKNGSFLYGKFRMSLKGDASNNVDQEIAYIGTKNQNSLFYFNDNNQESTIERKWSIGKGFINEKGSLDDKKVNNYTKNNLLYYHFHFTSSNANLTLNKFVINVSTYNMSFSSDKYDFYFPPFYSFEMISSTLSLNQKLVFMAGSYLIVDKNSMIILSSNGKQTSEKITYSGKTIRAAQEYEPTGGLLFIDKNHIHSIFETGDNARFFDVRNRNDKSRGKSPDEGYLNTIYCTKGDNGGDNFWNLTNSTPAYCNLYGKIQIREITNQQLSFQLGGRINIYDYPNFINEIKNKNKVQLFGSSFLSGPNRLLYENYFIGWYPNGDTINRLNITEYHLLPLISNGRVLTNNATLSYSNYKYNSDYNIYTPSGAIDYKNSYIFKFNEDFLNNNNNNSSSLTTKDTLEGQFVKVSFYTQNDFNNTVVTYNNINYLYFNGAWVKITKISGSTATVDLKKFQGENSTLAPREQNFTWDEKNKKWTPPTDWQPNK